VTLGKPSSEPAAVVVLVDIELHPVFLYPAVLSTQLLLAEVAQPTLAEVTLFFQA
jgi:hypothetical protein